MLADVLFHILLQAMALQELQHSYVCGYKEFFVTWDKEVRYKMVSD